jgi:hypothetical protein
MIIQNILVRLSTTSRLDIRVQGTNYLPRMPMSKRPDFFACVIIALSVSVKYLNSRFCRSTGMPRILVTQGSMYTLCHLLHDAITASQHMTSNGRTTVNNELHKIGKERKANVSRTQKWQRSQQLTTSALAQAESVALPLHHNIRYGQPHAHLLRNLLMLL